MVTTLELHRFWLLCSVNFIFGSNDRSLCVLCFDTKMCCIGLTISKLHAVIVRWDVDLVFLTFKNLWLRLWSSIDFDYFAL